MWRSSLWSISWLRHQMFYPYVTISAAQARESDDLRHAMSPFSLFLSSFSGVQRILGYVRPRWIVAVHPPETGRRRSIWRSLQTGTDFTWRCDIIGLQMLLWWMQTLNRDTVCSHLGTTLWKFCLTNKITGLYQEERCCVSELTVPV